MVGLNTPVLYGPDGKPLSLEGGLVAPHALNFANVFSLPGKTYPFGWDEALRDNPQNALAMRRDAFYRRLMQERTADTINLEWEVKAENPDDPLQKLEQDTMSRNWRDTPDRPGLITWLLEAIWFGRTAQQWTWGEMPSGMTGIVFHEPVHGDGVQFSWDNTPVVLVSSYTADKYRKMDPEAVVSGTDRGAWGLRLYRPELRNRFCIHKHVREASDYFEGEMAGGVHGVGLRSWCYWNGWMKREALGWMLGFMQSTGMMDLVIFNYPSGNKEAENTATANAKKLSGKVALICPRDPKGNWPAVEQLQMNTAGVEALRRLIAEYFDVQIEHLFVGQSMSTGGRDQGSLGGTGRAEFAQDTKGQIQKTDAMRLAETLTRDWLTPCHRFNFPNSKVRLKLEPVLADVQAQQKVENAVSLAGIGVPVEIDEVRRAAGFREPRPGKSVTKVQQEAKGPDPATLSALLNPNANTGGRATDGTASTGSGVQ